MITLNPSSLRNNPLAESGTAPASGGAITNPNIDPAGFASLLRQSQTPPSPPQPLPQATPAPAPAQTSASDAGTDNDKDSSATNQASSSNAPDPSEAPQENDPAKSTRALLKGKARAADGAAPQSRDNPSAADPAGAAQKPADAEKTTTAKPADTGAAGAALDPNVMQWLAGLQRSAAAASGGKGDAGAKTAADDASTPSLAGDARNAISAGQRAADLKAQDALQAQVALGLQSANPADNGSFGAVLVDQQEAEKPVGARGAAVDNVKDTAAAGAAGAGAFSPTSTVATAAPASVAVATPVTAPDFAQELGLRLSVLAKDGVQQAELHLNPADMGPVSVQIVMDGTQAHIAFGADMAATRQAIEAGLPELAGALRDAGFTLAGGGVSQHAGGRSGGGDSSRGDSEQRGRPVAADTVSRVGAAARRVVTQGGIDLFA